MKTAISLPDPLFEAADRLASRLGISRSQLFQRALQMLLERHEGAGVTAALNEVYGADDPGPPIDEVLARMQFASLPKEEW